MNWRKDPYLRRWEHMPDLRLSWLPTSVTAHRIDGRQEEAPWSYLLARGTIALGIRSVDQQQESNRFTRLLECDFPKFKDAVLLRTSQRKLTAALISVVHDASKQIPSLKLLKHAFPREEVDQPTVDRVREHMNVLFVGYFADLTTRLGFDSSTAQAIIGSAIHNYLNLRKMVAEVRAIDTLCNEQGTEANTQR